MENYSRSNSGQFHERRSNRSYSFCSSEAPPRSDKRQRRFHEYEVFIITVPTIQSLTILLVYYSSSSFPSFAMHMYLTSVPLATSRLFINVKVVVSTSRSTTIGRRWVGSPQQMLYQKKTELLHFLLLHRRRPRTRLGFYIAVLYTSMNMYYVNFEPLSDELADMVTRHPSVQYALSVIPSFGSLMWTAMICVTK